MNISTLIYYSICLLGFSGVIILLKEKQRRKLGFARRWRTKIEGVDYKSIPVLKIYFNALERNRLEHAEVEIFEAISFMRNLIAIGEEGSLSSDTLIEQLILHRGDLSPIYSGTLNLLRQNRREDAINYFSESVGTKNSKDFARLLIQWDSIEPKQLHETLLSHQKNIREDRITNQKRRDEIISDLIYLPVVINIMLIFINFIYVGYFIDQKEMLTMLI